MKASNSSSGPGMCCYLSSNVFFVFTHTRTETETENDAIFADILQILYSVGLACCQPELGGPRPI